MITLPLDVAVQNLIKDSLSDPILRTSLDQEAYCIISYRMHILPYVIKNNSISLSFEVKKGKIKKNTKRYIFTHPNLYLNKCLSYSLFLTLFTLFSIIPVAHSFIICFDSSFFFL